MATTGRQTLCEYFDEDVVVKRSATTGRLTLGLVIQSCENTSDNEDSDDEDSFGSTSSCDRRQKWSHVKPGFARIAVYPNGTTRIIDESKAKLYDRSLLNGDVVQRLDPLTNKLSPNSEHGLCQSTRILATTKILGTDKVIENVNTNDMDVLLDISEDTVCLLDSWIGYIREINLKITLKCTDGSLLVVDDQEISDFEDLLTQRESNDTEFSRDDYYIGQQLLGYKSDLKDAKWLKQTKQMKRYMKSQTVRNSKINLVVEDVAIDNVSINWLCCLSDDNLCNKYQSINAITGNSLKNSIRDKSQSSSIGTSTHPMGTIIRGEALSRLKCLNHFRKCSAQIGHQYYYTIKETDDVISLSEWEAKESTKLFNEETNAKQSTNDEMNQESDNETSNTSNDNTAKTKSNGDNISISSLETNNSKNKRAKKRKNHFSLSLRKIKSKKLHASNRKTSYTLPIDASAGARLPIEIMATNTQVSVVWQNSEVERDVPSIYLYPVHNIDNHDFFPGDFVVENKDISQSYDYGVIAKCDYASRTAVVNWMSTLPDSPTPQYIAQQELSVYDIKDHPDFNFRPGVCIVRILSLNEDNCDPESRTGQVIDTTLDGMLNCVWLNGQTSSVFPQTVFVVGDYDSDDLWGDSDMDYDSDLSVYESAESWETTDLKSKAKQSKKSPANVSHSASSNSGSKQKLLNLLQNGATQVEEWLKDGTNGLQNPLKLIAKCEANSEDKSPKSLHNYSDKLRQMSKLFLQRLSWSQSSESGSTSKTDGTICNDKNDNINNNESNVVKSSSSDSQNALSSIGSNINSLLDCIDELNTSLETTQDMNAENCDQKLQTVADEEPEVAIKANDITETKGDVIFLDKIPDNHKYLYSTTEPKNSKNFLKRIKYEITLLKNSLPEGICVTLFHDRLDLLSVMIFGPKDTPYEDGLFLFDIQLPTNYPNGPPLVHYISYCSDRLNPNLYESGKVCVSLLGTWSGKGTEVWSPSASNLLQVIVSIQGLILVDEPYYNEAGYSKQKGTTMASENSRLYNEMVVIKMIQSMTKMLLTPHKAFEEQMRQHIITIGRKFIERHRNWAQVSQMCISQSKTSSQPLSQSELLSLGMDLPAFPLLPASHGFCLSLNKSIDQFEETLNDSLK